MAQRRGEQSDKTMNREIKPDAGCDVFGRQYDQHDNPYWSGYQDVEFEGPDNRLLPQDPQFNHRGATPGEGQFGSRQFSEFSEKESLGMHNVISLEDQHSGGSQNRASTYFVGPDQSPDGRYGDDRAPVIWPGDRPQSTAPDFGDQLQRGDVTNRSFRKGK